ncbi:MAG: alpha-galactosidase [Rhodothermia bacterium]|nr:alpha-galactosidase [Rhodothermia bacterium]
MTETESLKIVVVGAGSREFGPAMISDILLSQPIRGRDCEVVLMDRDESSLPAAITFAEQAVARTESGIRFRATSELDKALQAAHFVVSAIEANRYFYWSQDFHIPRKYGFRQIYGENGGPGGLFHALRNIGPMLDIASAMERACPTAILLNFTNPLTKLCQALAALSPIRTIGLCHGVYQGKKQIARFLSMDTEDLDARASGINHFTWFETIRNRKTGDDLYPRLREAERNAHWLAEWDEIALSRILFRTYGLYPSPGANHIGEYLSFASEFLASDKLQFFHDRRDGDPWQSGRIPTWIYNLEAEPTATPLFPEDDLRTISKGRQATPDQLVFSGELAVPIIESLSCDVSHFLDAVNVLNDGGLVPGLPEDAIVEVPAESDGSGVHPIAMTLLPEGVLALLRTQVSINKLLVEAFSSGSREPLLQATLLDPSVDSYQQSVEMINEMFRLQADVLPEMTW